MPSVPGVRFLPNALTVLAMCAGLSAFYFADRAAAGTVSWLVPLMAIGAAGILDSIDGPAARLLGSTSRIGAELDSLSDLVSFGVAPALVIYVWDFSEGRSAGWVCCLVYAVCIGLRLARFNSLLEDKPKPWAKGFFTGIPSPAAGLMVTIPLALSHRFPDNSFFSNQWTAGLWLIVVGLLAVSRVPSIALKSVRVPPWIVVPLLILLVAGVAGLFFEPEILFAAGMGVYFLHLPYSTWKYFHLKNHPEKWPTDERQPRQRFPSAGRIRLRVPQRRRVAGRATDGTPLPAERARRTQRTRRLR
jgi:CDP-diacylglycerol---serine O-phosphatidyltransferase